MSGWVPHAWGTCKQQGTTHSELLPTYETAASWSCTVCASLLANKPDMAWTHSNTHVCTRSAVRCWQQPAVCNLPLPSLGSVGQQLVLERPHAASACALECVCPGCHCSSRKLPLSWHGLSIRCCTAKHGLGSYLLMFPATLTSMRAAPMWSPTASRLLTST